jgi:MATE family multidrug resistance protein
MLCLEWWAWEIMTLLSGYIGVTDQAANVLFFQINGMVFMVCLGLQTASGANIGQQIGRGNIKKAQAYFYAANCVSLVVIILTITFVFALRRPAFSMFTTNKELNDKATSVMWLVCLCWLPDLFQVYL